MGGLVRRLCLEPNWVSVSPGKERSPVPAFVQSPERFDAACWRGRPGAAADLKSLRYGYGRVQVPLQMLLWPPQRFGPARVRVSLSPWTAHR
jgi:hypothetical protein